MMPQGVASPIWISGADKKTPRLAPGIGEHTRDVLTDAGFGAGEIDAMLKEGIAQQRETDPSGEEG